MLLPVSVSDEKGLKDVFLVETIFNVVKRNALPIIDMNCFENVETVIAVEDNFDRSRR